jgi:hypothetical protein
MFACARFPEATMAWPALHFSSLAPLLKVVQKHQQLSARRPASFSWLGHKLALVIRLHFQVLLPKQGDGSLGTFKAAAARASLCRGLELDYLMRPR